LTLLAEAVGFFLNTLAFHFTESTIDKIVETLKNKYGDDLEDAWKQTIDNVSRECNLHDKQVLSELRNRFFEVATVSKTDIDVRNVRGLLLSKGLSSSICNSMLTELRKSFKKKAEKILCDNPKLYRRYTIEKFQSTEQKINEIKEGISRIAQQKTSMSLVPSNYSYISGTKEVWIKNSQGDCALKRKWIVKNNSNQPMKKLVFDIQHQDALDIPVCKIDGQKVNFRVQTVKTEPFDKEISRLTLPYLTRVSIDLEEFQILPESVFVVELLEEGHRTFKDMFVEDFSNIYVKTAYEQSFTTIIHAYDGIVFSSSNMKFEVIDDVGSQDIEEISRLRGNGPKLIDNGKTISWTVAKPKMRDNYTLKFSVCGRQP
jgi:hypothetical protein